MRRAALVMALAGLLQAPAVALVQEGGGASTAPAATAPAPAAPATPVSAAADAAAAPAASGRALREQMSPEAERRLRKLEEELRCLVCQNQTLADSDADLAVDLRRQVESMVAAGRSDAQIKDYLVERYGDFVLYRPPVQRNTLALWLGPFLLLAVGVGAWIVVQRRSTRVTALRPEAPAADRERARRLLDE